MAPDLRHLLRDAAAEPRTPFDAADVRRRAGRVRRARRARMGAVVAAAALLLVVAPGRLLPGGRVDLAPGGPGPAPLPSDGLPTDGLPDPISTLPEGLPGATPSATDPPQPEPQSTTAVATEGDDAPELRPVWPPPGTTVTGHTAEAIDRRDPELLVLAYGGAQLGWDDARIAGAPDVEGTRSTYRLTRDAGTPVIAVSVEAGRDGRWWVVGVRPDDGVEHTAGVRVAGGRASVAYEHDWAGVDVAELHVRYGDDLVTARADEPPAAWEDVVLPFPHDRPGAVTVILSSREHGVVAVWATGLPPGDFAAG